MKEKHTKKEKSPYKIELEKKSGKTPMAIQSMMLNFCLNMCPQRETVPCPECSRDQEK